MNLMNVVIGKDPVYFHAKYGRTIGDAERRTETPIQLQAIAEDVPAIPASMNKQSVTTKPAEHVYPVRNCYPTFERQPAFTPSEVSDSSLTIMNPVHITPVQYNVWQMMTGFSTGETLQGSSVPSINNIYSGFITDPAMGQQPFAQVPPFQSI
jgi:hypothetical protein